MKIAIIGTGKLGSTVLELNKKHTVSYAINSKNSHLIQDINRSNTEVVIHTATPQQVIPDARILLPKGLKMIIATTGFDKNALQQLIQEHQSTVVQDGNFSIGVNILFMLNTYLAKLMNHFPEYDVAIHEIHHNLKKDAPGGTAIQLAEDIIKHLNRKHSWTVPHQTIQPNQISVSAARIGSVIGTHEIIYDSNIDTLYLKHVAKNRQGFAQGILMAVEFLEKNPDIKGWIKMQQIIEHFLSKI
ncbi:MAG: 4-hydroxy-tetrahydrodipicolinate reductase [Bacteroidia bacterium]|nr:4-hydroxy-tetrahydrodipicolinate reductase [Bacteroidia bacterium]MDW8302025.1 4-hydroxy-tetrahydrodipicolinate reductase [Bacteroidia bacterium]